MRMLLHRLLSHLATGQHLAVALALLHPVDQLTLVTLHLAGRERAARKPLPARNLDQFGGLHTLLELGFDLRQPRLAHRVFQSITHQRTLVGYGLALHAALSCVVHALLRGGPRLLWFQFHTWPLCGLGKNALRLMPMLCGHLLITGADFIVGERLLRIARLMRRDLGGASSRGSALLHVLDDLLAPRTRRLQV